MYQLVSELPNVNRDTLAYLLLHLHKYERADVPAGRLDVHLLFSVSRNVAFYHTVEFLASFRVMKSPHCQMNQNNLARVFGPTVVGHGMPEPSPTTIMRDTNTQLKVSVFLERFSKVIILLI